MAKITVTYIIEFGSQKLTRIAEAEVESDKAISDEFIESLWALARKSLPKEKQEAESHD